MEFSPLAVMLLLISLIPVPHAQGSPKAMVSIEPDTHVYSGEIVTFRCDVQGGGDTEWTYSWYRNNDTLDLDRIDISYIDSTMQEIIIWFFSDSDGGDYTCRGQSSDSQSSEISDAVTLTVSERPQVVLSVSPQSWMTEGDSVTLSCEITDSSTDWTFSWYTVIPYRLIEDIIQYRAEPLSDSSRESGDSYTLSPAALNHTGVYVCRAESGERVYHTGYSNEQPLWITGESPPVSLIINPNRTQHFTNDSLSLSCEDQSNSTGWTVGQYTDSEGVVDCSQWGSVTGSTCEISFLSTSYTGVYWCESESGENSNPVNITVHDGDVILESPVHPVTEEHPPTLRCLYRYPNSPNLRDDFYKDGSVLQTQTTGEMIIRTVSKSDEGFYHCKHPERGESPKSWVSVRRVKPSSVSDSRASAGTAGVAVGLGFLFIALLILMILLWSYKRKKENQTSEQNQIRSGAEDSQSGHTPLQAGSENVYAAVDQTDMSGTGEAAAESREDTYAQVTKKKKTNRNNGADAEPGVDDVTYAEIELKPMIKAKRMKENASVGDDTVYSELKHNMG